MVSGRPGAAAYAARRRRLRRRHRVHHLRHLRRQGVDLQGRDPRARSDGAGQEDGRGRCRPSAPRRVRAQGRTNRKVAAMLQPMKTKFRKAHKGRIKGLATSGAELSFGEYGLKAMEPDRVSARQIEAARRAMTRHMKRSGRVWIRIFPDVPVSKKPLEVRMGSGKGAPEMWVCRVKPGRIMFEIDGVTVQTAKEALSLAAAKLPIKTRFVARIAE